MISATGHHSKAELRNVTSYVANEMSEGETWMVKDVDTGKLIM